MREHTIKVSGEEMDRLDEVSLDIFSTTSVPYGEVIGRLVEEYYNQ